MSDESSNNTPALSARKETGCAGCFVWTFAIMFLSAGLGSGYFLTFQPLWGMWRSQSWVQTPCKIVSSELKHHEDSSSVAIVYTYSVADKDYQSDRYCFMAMSSNTAGEWKQRVIAQNPAGKHATCFVNPNDPNDAVIERGWVSEMWWGLFPIPFLLIGFVSLLVAIGLIRTSNPNAEQKSSQWSPKPHKTAASESGEFGDSNWQSSGPVTLSPESTPLQMLIGSAIVAALWNGFMTFFIWDDIERFLRGGFAALNLFHSLFMIPFVLVGMALILFVLYSMLSLFNPRPTLVVNSSSIPLGEELSVNWSFSGRPGSIRKLTISLKGVEKATYRRGTTTTTDKSMFANIEVYETTDSFDMEEGSAKITIPDDSMHSFDAPNNKIVWTLEVHGDIPLWPDVSAAFPITILPMVNED